MSGSKNCLHQGESDSQQFQGLHSLDADRSLSAVFRRTAREQRQVTISDAPWGENTQANWEKLENSGVDLETCENDSIVCVGGRRSGETRGEIKRARWIISLESEEISVDVDVPRVSPSAHSMG